LGLKEWLSPEKGYALQSPLRLSFAESVDHGFRFEDLTLDDLQKIGVATANTTLVAALNPKCRTFAWSLNFGAGNP
jgi:hypothetical protein